VSKKSSLSYFAMPRSFAVCSLALSNLESILSKSKASVGTTALSGTFWFDTLPNRPPPLPPAPLGCGILPPEPLPPGAVGLSGGGGFGFDVGKPACAAAAKLVGFTYAGFAASITLAGAGADCAGTAPGRAGGGTNPAGCCRCAA